jgi:hypothetical protein
VVYIQIEMDPDLLDSSLRCKIEMLVLARHLGEGRRRDEEPTL